MGHARNEESESGNESETEGEGTNFWHKERDLSSRIVASATDFLRFFQIFFEQLSLDAGIAPVSGKASDWDGMICRKLDISDRPKELYPGAVHETAPHRIYRL